MKRRSLFLSVLLATSIAGCCEVGSGEMVKDVRSIDSFSRIEVDVPAALVVNGGPLGLVQLRTDDNLIDGIRTEVEGDTLRIDFDHHCCIEPTALEIAVATESLEKLSIDGSADVLLETTMSGPSLELEIDGSGSITSTSLLQFAKLDIEIDGSAMIDAELEVTEVKAEIDGSADLVLAGTAGEFASNIDGSASIRALGLATDRTHICIDGSGDVEVTVFEELEVDIDGSGSVSYCGTPSIDRDIDGSGSVVQRSLADCQLDES